MNVRSLVVAVGCALVLGGCPEHPPRNEAMDAGPVDAGPVEESGSENDAEALDATHSLDATDPPPDAAVASYVYAGFTGTVCDVEGSTTSFTVQLATPPISARST